MATTTTYNATGSVQTLIVPAGVTSILVDAYGAQGGSPGSAGGLGGRTQATLTVTPGETLSLLVGRSGDAGGYNGGGRNSNTNFHGGGASDLRRGGTALSNRILVAGGGGAGSGATGTQGGTGGGLTGGTGGQKSGEEGNGGTGGTQSAGGSLGGASGVGGTSTDNSNPGGGGGGGFFGGGAGQTGGPGLAGGGGGGGSSLVPAGGTTTAGARSGDGAITLTYNQPPNAPTLTTLTGSETIARSDVNRAAHSHSDPDGDSQTAFRLGYRLVGAASFTTLADQVTVNQFYDFPAASLALGNYERRVATRDSVLWGPYSASSFFTVADRPAGPTITAPTNGATISQATSTFAWSTPSQQAYEVRQVADNAGAANTSVVYATTGVVESVGARQVSLSHPVNGRAEHQQIRTRDGGLWSPWSSVRVSVSYTPPAQPNLTLFPVSTVEGSTGTDAIELTFSQPTPTGGAPSVSHVDAYRRVASSTGEGIRRAKDQPATGRWLDRTVASGVEYAFRLRAFGTNGTSTFGPWVTVPLDPAPFTLTFQEAF